MTEQELEALERYVDNILDGVMSAIDCNDTDQCDIAADLFMAWATVCLCNPRSGMADADYEAFVEEAVSEFRRYLLAAKHNLSVKSLRESKAEGGLQ
jgi:hypothetical protein